MRVSESRFQEVLTTGVRVIALAAQRIAARFAAAFSLLQDRAGHQRERWARDAPKVLDIAQLVAERLDALQAPLKV